MDNDSKLLQSPESLPIISPSQPIIVSTSTPKSQNDNVSYASLWIRLLAYIIDLIMLLFLTLILGLYFGIIITFLKLSRENISNSILRIPELFLNYFFYVFYSTTFLSIYSATPGKYLCRIKVTDERNNRINITSSLIRSLLQPFSTFLFGIGYVSMLKSDKKQAWHDKIAKTIVIYSSEKTGFIRKFITYILVFLGLIFLLMVTVVIKNNLFR